MSNSSRRITNRVLSVILAVLLMVGMLPTSVFAAVPGTHEGVFSFTVTDGENPIAGAEVSYTVASEKAGEAPVTSMEEKVTTGADGVAEVTTNLPTSIEADVTLTVNYTVEANGYTAKTDAYAVATLTDDITVTMTACSTVDVTAVITGKGSVTVGDTPVDAANPAKIAESTVNTIVVTPDTGYEISSLSVGGTAIVINETNKSGYTDATYQFDATTEIKATFVDVQAPEISLVKAAPDGWANADKTVTVTATDNSGFHTVFYYFTSDGESAAQEAQGDRFTANRLGNYTVYAVDAANNKCAEQTVNVTQVDKDAPVVDSITGDPASWVTEATISGVVSDSANGSGVNKVVFGTSSVFEDAVGEGVTFERNTGHYSFKVTANGTYYVWAVDAAGNHSKAESIQITKVDNTDPTISAAADPDGWTNGAIKVEIVAKDEQSNVTVKYSDVAVNDPGAVDATREGDKWVFNIEKAIDGIYTYYVWAEDEAGHQASAEVKAYFDGTAPVVTITPLASTNWTNQDVTITGTVDGVTESASVSGLDKVVYGTDDDPRNATGVATVEGPNYSFTVATNGTYNVWSLDKAGNYSDVATITINYIDKVKPSISVSEDEYAWSKDSVTVSGIVADAHSGIDSVWYNTINSLNGATQATELSGEKYSFVVPNSSNVNTIYYIWTRDKAGNDSDPATTKVQIDITNPTISADTKTSGSGRFRKTVVSGVATDADSGIKRVVYGTVNDITKASDEGVMLNRDGSYKFTIPRKQNFNGTYYIWAEDNVGNFVRITSDEITIDIVPPTVDSLVVTPNVNEPSIWTNGPVVISGVASDAADAIYNTSVTEVKFATEDDISKATSDGVTLNSDGSFSFTVANNQEFNGYYYVWAIDEDGNESASSKINVKIETTEATIGLNPSVPAVDNGDPSVYGFYNNNVTIGVQVDDKSGVQVDDEGIYSGIKSVEYWVTADGVETQRETLFPRDKANSTQAEPVNSWEGDFVVEADKNNSCNVIVYVKVIDNAGNENIQSVALDIDQTAPAINVSYDDNEPSNGKYFNGTRTATIQITERSHHFVEPTVYINPEKYPESDTNCIIIYATDAGKTPVVDEDNNQMFIPSIDWMQTIDLEDADKTVYTATIPYNVDANYTFEIKVMDKATNQNTTVNIGNSVAAYEFTVDTTDPTGSASIGTNVWDKLLESLTFGLYTNEKFDVLASANDITSPLEIEYYKVSGDEAPIVFKEADLDAVSTWSPLLDNGENTVKDMHTLTVSDDEQFVVYFKITDYAGNYIYICTDGAIVEDTPPAADEPAPEITMKPEQPINGFYNGDVKVDIKVTDPLVGETYSGLKSISYKVFNMGKVTQEDTLYTFEKTAPTNDELVQTWTDSIVVDSKLNNSNDVRIEVYAQDNAGNTSSNSVNIKIDTTAPKIDVRYDNDNVDSGIYYQADRTATIVVTERNFKSEDVILTITNTDGTIPAISNWTAKGGTGNGDNTTYTATITYAADGDYTFAIEYADLANNKCTEINSTSTNPYAFTIDKTAPTINVSYNNNEVANDKYFKAARMATVTVVEHNFDVDRVTFNRNATRGGRLPNVTWTNNGDTHVATISYTVDGDYTFDVSMTDMAGNASGAAGYGNSAAGKDFVIDTTYEDMITISGVENGVAYGHDAEVIPNIKISDINLNDYTVNLIGVQKDKTIDLTKEVNKLLDAGTETVTGVFDVFETKQDLDGIYTLTLTSKDKAGNTDSEEIVFTVNRYGSVYVYNQYLLDLIADGGSYVLRVDEDLVIDEFNADRLVADSLKIEITVDGRPLENVKYTCTPEINNTVSVGESGWFQYRYTISKDNFADDGVYKISISSKDATGNQPENTNYEGMEMTFRVDSTKAEITSIVGLEESIINAQEVVVKYTVFDTIGLKSIKVYVNGKLIDEINDFSADMNNFSGQFTLTEQTNTQSVQIVVEDMSGNITDTSSNDFTSAYAFHDSVTVSTNFFVRWYANKLLFWGSIVGVVVLTGVIWFLIAFKRRKKEEK